MHLIAEKGPLAGALASAAKVAVRSSMVPVATHILLELRGDELSITATNYDMDLRSTLQVQGRSDGSICLPGHKLSDIVRAAPEGAQVEIMPAPKVGEEGSGQFTVKFGRSRYTLPSLKADEFPSMRLAAEDGATFALSDAALQRLLAVTAPFTLSDDKTKYYLCGVYLHRIGDELVAVGCDGHRLGRAGIPAPEGAEGDVLDAGIIIPTPTIRHLQSMVAGEASVQVTENLIGVKWGSTKLTSKLIDGVFPDYRAIVAQATGGNVTIEADAKTIKDVTARVALATTEKTKLVRLAVAEDGIITFTASGENGEAGEEAMPSVASGAAVIGYNARYLADAMAVAGNDKVTIRIGSDPDGTPSMTPTLVNPAGDDAVTLVVMPMRTL